MGKLSKTNISKILAMLSGTDVSFDSIAKIFSISRHVVYQMNDGKAHKSESIEYPIRKLYRRKSRLSDKQIKQVSKFLEDGLSYLEIVEKTGVAKDTIAKIKNGDLK
jgi:predicted DNA-binding protein YlxM (UPF0122 family)